MTASGSAKLQLSARSVGLIEAVYNSVKPHELLAAEIEIASGSGKIPDGTEIPFEFRLDGFRGRTLHETYHGVYVNVQYVIAVRVSDLSGLERLTCVIRGHRRA